MKLKLATAKDLRKRGIEYKTKKICILIHIIPILVMNNDGTYKMMI